MVNKILAFLQKVYLTTAVSIQPERLQREGTMAPYGVHRTDAFPFSKFQAMAN
jgi:hypothetical protein